MTLLAATREGLARVDGEVSIFEPKREFLALAAPPAPSRICFAGSTRGTVFRSDDGGESWIEQGRLEGFVELSSLAVEPDHPDRVLAGMEPAALMVSPDGGRSWSEDLRIRDLSEENGWSVPWSDANGHVRTIAIHPRHPAWVLLAIEVGGVVVSHDGGKSWTNARGGIHDDVHSVAFDPRDPMIAYAATRHGFGHSTDGGYTWVAANPFEGQGYARPLAIDPERPYRLFIAAATTGPGGFDRPNLGSECGIYRSEDGGATWSRLTNGLPARFGPYVDGLAINPHRADHVALADTEGNLFESTDGGDSWTQTHRLPPVRRLLFV